MILTCGHSLCKKSHAMQNYYKTQWLFTESNKQNWILAIFRFTFMSKKNLSKIKIHQCVFSFLFNAYYKIKGQFFDKNAIFKVKGFTTTIKNEFIDSIMY